MICASQTCGGSMNLLHSGNVATVQCCRGGLMPCQAGWDTRRRLLLHQEPRSRIQMIKVLLKCNCLQPYN
jgi:hypothetical protein